MIRCWERLKVGGEGDDRGWGGWMAWQTQWTWAWASSGSWWWMGKPGMLQSLGFQRVRHDWVTELNWIFHYIYTYTTYSLFICWWTIRLFPCHGYLVPLWTQGCIYLFELQFCLDVCPEVGLLGYMATILLVFWGISILFSIVAALTYILSNSVGGFPFLHTLSNICYL